MAAPCPGLPLVWINEWRRFCRSCDARQGSFALFHGPCVQTVLSHSANTQTLQ